MGFASSSEEPGCPDVGRDTGLHLLLDGDCKTCGILGFLLLLLAPAGAPRVLPLLSLPELIVEFRPQGKGKQFQAMVCSSGPSVLNVQAANIVVFSGSSTF